MYSSLWNFMDEFGWINIISVLKQAYSKQAYEVNAYWWSLL